MADCLDGRHILREGEHRESRDKVRARKAADAVCIGTMHSSLRQTQVEIFLLFSISIFSRL